MNALKRLTYRRELRSLTRLLGLSRTLSDWYFHWARPRDGILRLQAERITGEFHIRTREELRFLESMGLYERAILELLIQKVKFGDVIYDVGAHVGLYTILLAKAVGEQGYVVAFEPERATYDRLQENLTLNNVTNVRSFRKALGERNGDARIHLGEIGNLSLLPPDPRNMNHQLVEMVEGDGFREAEHLPVPRIIKIDVEGYEYAVLEGLQRTLVEPACELIVCEIHPTMLPANVGPEAVLARLISLGFTSISSYPGWHVIHAVGSKSELAAE